jgi:hypothetical protein
MIKAAAKGIDGRELLILGLTFANLKKFQEAPLDTYIKIDGKELGLNVDVTIFSCQTEAHGAELMKEFINANTKVTTSDRLKN